MNTWVYFQVICNTAGRERILPPESSVSTLLSEGCLEADSRCTVWWTDNVSSRCLQAGDWQNCREHEPGQIHETSGHFVSELWTRSRALSLYPSLQSRRKGCSAQLHNRSAGQLATESRNQQLPEAMLGQVRQDEGQRLNGACGKGQRCQIWETGSING